MEWPNQEEIPKSNIRGNVSIGGDFGSLGDKGKILFVDPRCFIVGVGDVPYMLFTTPEFNNVDLPESLITEIYKVERLTFQSTFNDSKRAKSEYYTIPQWLTNFKYVSFLCLNHVELDNLSYLEGLSINNLILKDIKINDNDNFLIAISQFKHLKEVSYDESLPLNIKQSIEKLNLKLTLVDKPKLRD